MAQIVPKLNLNKTPAIVESNSLVFAKNIRLDMDGSIHRDYGILPMSISNGVNYEVLINRIIKDVRNIENKDTYTELKYKQLQYISGNITKDIVKINGETKTIIISNANYNIVGIIPNNNEFYIFINGTYISRVETNARTNNPSIDSNNTCDFIICYDEKTNSFSICNCNWHWSGGKITGYLVNNLRGEKILNIGEYDTPKLVPFKSINLSKSKLNDDERIYTQTPNIPITNINHIGYFNFTIPNGVYQFFVRYKIRDEFYTDWFPASKELFIGNNNITNTSFGTVKYVNTHRDSDSSFIFSIEHLFIDKESNYKGFQIGFIISHDDAIMARAWKTFDFNIDTIYFDYNANDAVEADVIDLIKNTYQIYNVKNITSFKNRLYISNYKETNFNEDYQALADNIIIGINTETSSTGYGNYEVLKNDLGIYGLKETNSENTTIEKTFSGGANSIIEECLTANAENGRSIKDAISDAIDANEKSQEYFVVNRYDITISGHKYSLESAKDSFALDNPADSYEYETDIHTIKVEGNYINIEDSPLLTTILSAIINKQRYLNDNCEFVDEKGNPANSITIEITRPCSYTNKIWIPDNTGGGGLPGGIQDPENNPLDDDKEQENNINAKVVRKSSSNQKGHYEDKTTNSFYTQRIVMTLKAYIDKYNISLTNSITRYTTLIPYQEYKFYIHYVKQNGEITNGYCCGGNNNILKVPFKDKVDSIIYPTFSNISLPTDCVACFFSILHVGNIVATVYNIDRTNSTTNEQNNIVEVNVESSCMDINTGLISGSENITIRQGNLKTDKAKYHYSSDSSNIRYFGADGVIHFDGITCDIGKSGEIAYIVNKYNISENENIQLTKCTPFINPTKLNTKTIGNKQYNTYSDYSNMNLLGFICAISPLDRSKTINYYTDTASVFYKNNLSTESTGTSFNLVELKNHLLDTNESKERLTALQLIDSPIVHVYSNYNLNYLTLEDEPIESYKSYYENTSESVNDKNSTGSIVLRLFKSLLMSSIYTLPNMYKHYTKKTYSVYNKNDIIEFNNTIRRSDLEGDEASINLFKFDPNDYYNVPTNRGLIVNLISVGDSILAHTEDSMFRFSGTNSLQSSDGEIRTTESNVFDTGISEVFGSDFGFAGLQVKTDAIVTEKGYIFFDRDSRVVYMYSGNGQIAKLSDSIEKLFEHRNIENVKFANDYYNNRFFMCILFYETYKPIDSSELKERAVPVTLSFNFADEIKSFVSLHDFYYQYSFNTKSKCYFLTRDSKDICNISKANTYKGCYSKLELTIDRIYPQKNDIITVYLKKYNEDFNLTHYKLKSYNSIIDVINNTEYESIKTLNAVNWCGYEINDEFINVDKSNEETLNMVEVTNYDTATPCKYIRIYSDTCMTPLLDCSKKANVQSITDLSYSKYPFYNQGVWTFNYFRNILNSKDNKIKYSGDNNSLIEGKYIVVRFIFNTDFKLETLYLNYQRK